MMDFLPVHLAILKKNIDIFKLLFNKDNPNPKNEKQDGLRSLHYAVLVGADNIFEYILKNIGDEDVINDVDNKGRTALHFTFAIRNYALCEKILNQSDSEKKEKALRKKR